MIVILSSQKLETRKIIVQILILIPQLFRKFNC